MIKIEGMKPFYTKVSGVKLRIVFAFQYFTISKDDEDFHFIPIEGKEIIFNLDTEQVENLSEVFVFQRGNRFIRLPLYQLMLVSNIHEFLTPIINDNQSHKTIAKTTIASVEVEEQFDESIQELINKLEMQNIIHAIDIALENGKKEEFKELSIMLNNLLTRA